MGDRQLLAVHRSLPRWSVPARHRGNGRDFTLRGSGWDEECSRVAIPKLPAGGPPRSTVPGSIEKLHHVRWFRNGAYQRPRHIKCEAGAPETVGARVATR